MRNLKSLFEYQKFNPNARLQAKIDAVTDKYLSCGTALLDDELNMVAAAGEPCGNKAPAEEMYADRGRRPGRGL